MKKHHGKGLCPGCYNSTFFLDKVKEHNARRYHSISVDFFKKLSKRCVLCGFDKIIELHHLDHNVKNNSEDNFVGLCPNHHKMLHSKRYQKEIFEDLKEKGFKIPKSNYLTDNFVTKGLRKSG